MEHHLTSWLQGRLGSKYICNLKQKPKPVSRPCLPLLCLGLFLDSGSLCIPADLLSPPKHSCFPDHLNKLKEGREGRQRKGNTVEEGRGVTFLNHSLRLILPATIFLFNSFHPHSSSQDNYD